MKNLMQQMKENKKLCILAGGGALLAVVAVVVLLFATGVLGKPIVNLNDYVKIREEGYEGRGYVVAELDFDKIVDDYEEYISTENLNSSAMLLGSSKTIVAAICEKEQPFVLEYDDDKALKNGDTVEFEWDTSELGMETLQEVLDVRFKMKDFKYEMKKLEDVKEVDLFENIEVKCYGFNGEGTIYESTTATIELDNEEILEIGLSVYAEYDGELSNGDTAIVSLSEEEDAEWYGENYGIVFAETEKEVVLDGFTYYPYEDYSDIFTYMENGTSIENATFAQKDWLEYQHRTDNDYAVEYVGSYLYYQNEGNELDTRQNKDNRLVMIFHIEDGKVPGGWYSYLSPVGNVAIGNETLENGETVKATITAVAGPISDNYYYFERESFDVFTMYDYETSFEHGGLDYIGHRDIQSCVNAFVARFPESNDYDHVIADDTLKDYVTTK